MSSRSRSRSNGHYPHNNYGAEHYKRKHGSGGLLGKILENLTGSKGRSDSNSNHHKGYHPRGHHRKSSWS